MIVRYRIVYLPNMILANVTTDDLPVIKENIKRTFLETQTKVNRWVADLKKKIDGEDDEDEDDEMDHSRTQGFNTGLPPQQYGVVRRSGEFSRRSGDRDRYDADPRVLGDDFAGLELRDEEGNKTLPRIAKRRV